MWVAGAVPFVADSHEYISSANLILSGHPFIPYVPPGLPLYLALFIAAGASSMVLRASMLFFWALTCWGLLRISRTLEMERIAWLVLLLFAVMPASIQMSIEPQTQQAAAALLLFALSAAIRCVRGAGICEYLLLGSSLGWLALVRPSSLPLLVIIPAVCFLASRKWQNAMLSVLLGCALVGGWMAWAHRLTGAWMINSANNVNLYYGNNPWTPVYRTWYFGSHAKRETSEIANYPEYARVLEHIFSLPKIEQSNEFKRMAVQHIMNRPGLFLFRTFNRITCYFGFDTFTSANLRNDGPLAQRLVPVSLALEALTYLCVAVPAFFWIAAAPMQFWQQWESRLLAGAVFLYSLPYWLVMSHPTYHYPVMLPLAVLAVLAWRASQSQPVRRTRGWVALVALGLIQIEWVLISMTTHAV